MHSYRAARFILLLQSLLLVGCTAWIALGNWGWAAKVRIFSFDAIAWFATPSFQGPKFNVHAQLLTFGYSVVQRGASPGDAIQISTEVLGYAFALIGLWVRGLRKPGDYLSCALSIVALVGHATLILSSIGILNVIFILSVPAMVLAIDYRQVRRLKTAA